MGIFHSYVSLPEGNFEDGRHFTTAKTLLKPPMNFAHLRARNFALHPADGSLQRAPPRFGMAYFGGTLLR